MTFRISNDKTDGSKYEFELYNEKNIKDLPLDKRGIAVIAKYNNNQKQRFLNYFVTEQLAECIQHDRLNYFQSNNNVGLIDEFNYKFKTSGNCILFCEIDKSNAELEDILKQIQAYQNRLNNI